MEQASTTPLLQKHACVDYLRLPSLLRTVDYTHAVRRNRPQPSPLIHANSSYIHNVPPAPRPTPIPTPSSCLGSPPSLPLQHHASLPLHLLGPLPAPLHEPAGPCPCLHAQEVGPSMPLQVAVLGGVDHEARVQAHVLAGHEPRHVHVPLATQRHVRPAKRGARIREREEETRMRLLSERPDKSARVDAVIRRGPHRASMTHGMWIDASSTSSTSSFD